MKRLNFVNGEIEFYPSSKLIYNKKYCAKVSDRLLAFRDYEGTFGINGCFIDIIGNADISGNVNVPSHIITSGNVNIVVPPNMNLSLRSMGQGAVNGELMNNLYGLYGFGSDFNSYIEKHFDHLFIGEEYETKIMTDAVKATTNSNKNNTITLADLCVKFNLVRLYVESRKPPYVERRYTSYDLSLMTWSELSDIERECISGEDYESALLVLKEKKLRPNDFQ